MLMKFNNLDLADESKYLITGLSGWDDMPELITGSAVRPRRHGSWPGGVLAPKRVVAIDLEVLADRENGNTNTEALLALRKAMAISDEEKPLTIDLDYGLGVEEINARVTSLILPMTPGYSQRRMASIEFTATDPRRYAKAWNSKTWGTRTRTPVPVYPVKYPKPYVTYSAPGDLSAVNEGTVETPPKFRIRGPITNPSITVKDSKGTRKISFALSLSSRQELVIDVQAGTARVGATSFYGDTRGALLEDMFLRPGLSTIHFSGTGNGAQNARLTAEWRSAYL